MIKKLQLLTIGLIVLLISTQSLALSWFKDKPAPKKPRYNYDTSRISSSVSNFWATHKMDVSVHALSYLGTMGASVGFHFSPQWTIEAGFGGAGHFEAFGGRAKYSLLKSSPLNPYFSGGFSYWKRNKKAPFDENDVSPGYLVRDLMSEADRRDGRIEERLIHGAVGLQYIFLDGSLKGFGAQIEGLILMDIEELVLAPTVSFGVSYYF